MVPLGVGNIEGAWVDSLSFLGALVYRKAWQEVNMAFGVVPAKVETTELGELGA